VSRVAVAVAIDRAAFESRKRNESTIETTRATATRVDATARSRRVASRADRRKKRARTPGRAGAASARARRGDLAVSLDAARRARRMATTALLRASGACARRGRRIAASARAASSASSTARSTRAVPLVVVVVGKGGGAKVDDAVDEYARRCARYAPFEEKTVKQNPKNVKDTELQKVHEGERVMRAITARDYVVLLDERGRDASSEEVAELVARIGDEGYERGVFVLGGPFGHGKDVIDRANESLRLSKMVLNHQVARLVVTEALYRAHTILRGEPYHH
jgi:23S rRNA (pseudouridine1915-N3)-methyltransferase